MSYKASVFIGAALCLMLSSGAVLLSSYRQLATAAAEAKPAPERKREEPTPQLNKWRLNLRSLEALRAEVRETEEKLQSIRQRMDKLAAEMGQARVEEIKAKQ